MDATYIQKEIEMCRIMDGLTKEQRNMRLNVFSTAMKKANRDQMYKTLVEKYNVLGKKLEELTNNQFVLDPNIIMSESRVRSYLANSKIAMYLQMKNIKSCNFEELKAHNEMLAETDNSYNPNDIKVAIEFYETLENLAKVENKTIEDIAYGLVFTVGFEVMSQDDKILVIDNNQAKIKSKERTIPTFEKNRVTALERLEEKRFAIGEQAYTYALEMINEVFDYYINGNREISLEPQTEKKI